MNAVGWLSIVALLLGTSTVTGLDKDVLPGREHYDNFVRGYITTKMMMFCYGHAEVQRWQDNVERHWYECEQINRPFAPNITKHEEPFPFTKSPFYGGRRVAALKYRSVMSMNILECVFRRLNLRLTGLGRVITGPVKAAIKKIKTGKRLKRYLDQGVDKCAQQINCKNFMEFGRSKARFLKLLTFYRCEMYNRLKSCIIYDMDRHRKSYEVRAVHKELIGLDDSKKRLAMHMYYMSSEMRGPFRT